MELFVPVSMNNPELERMIAHGKKYTPEEREALRIKERREAKWTDNEGLFEPFKPSWECRDDETRAWVSSKGRDKVNDDYRGGHQKGKLFTGKNK